MALIAACTLDPGVYLSMNVKGAGARPKPSQSIPSRKSPRQVSRSRVEQMNGLADQVEENTLFGRTGGAPRSRSAWRMIFAETTRGRWLDLWYHFAIMFEALFILTTLDAGTRVGRYLLQDFLGNVWKPLGDTSNTQCQRPRQRRSSSRAGAIS